MPPSTTPIYRIIYIDNLQVYLRRDVLHAPNHTPDDGLDYRTIHNLNIQQKRRIESIYCNREYKGYIHDYVAFYFGYRSPMLFQLHTGRVSGYTGGQELIIHLVTTCQKIESKEIKFVFSDGHGIASFTQWFDNLNDLNKVDWDMVYERIWRDTDDDPDRQRRKQAEFLVYRSCPWDVIHEIGVINQATNDKVSKILDQFPKRHRPVVKIHRDWYY